MPSGQITDLEGLLVGSAIDEKVVTGTTVVLCERSMRCAVDVRGGGPGTRETDALASGTLIDQVDAITLSGGSVYGLAAGDGVTALLGERRRGVAMGQDTAIPTAPIVPGAILFDLANGGNKDWGSQPPYRRLGAAALEAVASEVTQGRAGAAFGARAGTEQGGLGSVSAHIGDYKVGALVVVNSIGAVRHPGSAAFYAWPYEQDGEFGGARPWDHGPPQPIAADNWGASKTPGARQATTLGVVATNAPLSHAQCKRIAVMAQDGFARAIRPIHTPFDGDVVFALSTAASVEPVSPEIVAQIGNGAADCVARAIARGVWLANEGAKEKT